MYPTVFANHRKSLIQHCERSKLRLHFECTKVNSKCQKLSILACFWKPEACSQAVLPDRSVLIGQKWGKRPKFRNSNAKFWVILKQCAPASPDFTQSAQSPIIRRRRLKMSFTDAMPRQVLCFERGQLNLWLWGSFMVIKTLLTVWGPDWMVSRSFHWEVFGPADT